MAALISIRGLGLAHGRKRVFDGLSLDIEAGEFIVLLGPSGCGKSTLLNAIAGLAECDRGCIHIAGRDVTRAAPKDRGIGMVFQSYALYPRMTVRQNLSFGLRVARTPKAEIERRVREAAGLLQLGELLDRKPAELSGGQRQRVAIGRALARHVDIFLFDEPLSNLDARLRAELRVELKLLHRRLGNTMVFVTHDQVEAMTLADRVIVMRGGEIQQIAAPRDIYARPANLFVAGFIGSPQINLIEGVFVEANGTRHFVAGDERIPLDGHKALPMLRHTMRVTMGLRPEWLTLSPAVAGAHWLRGQATLVETLGADAILLVTHQGVPLRVRVEPEIQIEPGQMLSLGFDPKRALLYDAASGTLLG